MVIMDGLEVIMSELIVPTPIQMFNNRLYNLSNHPGCVAYTTIYFLQKLADDGIKESLYCG